jgi:phosphatidylserine decarboxylase
MTNDQPINNASFKAITSDQNRDGRHFDITWDLIQLLDHDAEVKQMLQQAIVQARQLNPDPSVNPVSDLESYFAFIDRCCRCLPWQICPSDKYDSLYDRIDQSMGCFYFVADQPLRQLEGKGYFHNSLIYHEPFRSWLIRFLSVAGSYLNTVESWNEQYYRNALANPDFHLDDGSYESPDNWKCFNDFFARKLADPSRRPIAAAQDNRIVISPADAQPQGAWKIAEDSRVIAEEPEEQAGLAIKTGTLRDVSVLLSGSEYAGCFAGGTMTHTFLDINDYHRYHFPLSGTVKEVLIIPQDDAPGGVITWDKELQRYHAYFAETFGWQSIETRGVVIVERDEGGLVAIVPVGVCQVASVNFEEGVRVGRHVVKGDPLGFFMFGGSDIVMLFDRTLNFQLTAPVGQRVAMGQPYGRIAD